MNTPTVTVLPGTDADAPIFRIEVACNEQNGLMKRSFVQVDKATTIPCGKVGPLIGLLHADAMLAVNRALLMFLGLA